MRLISGGLLAVSICLFAASLTLEAFCVDGECKGDGWLILLTGWIAAFASPANATWLANPVLLCAWTMIFLGLTGLLDQFSIRWKLLAMLVSLVAVAIAAAFLRCDSIIANEGGIANRLTGYRDGYYVWLASMAAAFLAAIALPWNRTATTKEYSDAA